MTSEHAKIIRLARNFPTLEDLVQSAAEILANDGDGVCGDVPHREDERRRVARAARPRGPCGPRIEHHGVPGLERRVLEGREVAGEADDLGVLGGHVGVVS